MRRLAVPLALAVFGCGSGLRQVGIVTTPCCAEHAGIPQEALGWPVRVDIADTVYHGELLSCDVDHVYLACLYATAPVRQVAYLALPWSILRM